MAAVTVALLLKKTLSAGNLEPVLPQHHNLPFNIKGTSRSVDLQFLCSRRTFFEFCHSFFGKRGFFI
jgi:hypothetical protein